MAQQRTSLMERASRSRQGVKFVTAVVIGLSLLALSALTLMATVVGLVITTPPLVLFSPVLVPAAAVAVIAGAGLVASGGFGVAAMAVAASIYCYTKGRRDALRSGLFGGGREVKEWTEYGGYVQNKAQRELN